MDTTYEGQDLEALADLPNYHAWIMGWFRPYLRGRVIEYGAGTGTLSLHIRPLVQHLTLVEPSRNLAPALIEKFLADPAVQLIASSLEKHITDQLGNAADAVVMVNVLEHIEDDMQALRAFQRIIVPGGHLLIFVPALHFLMSDLDRKIGHYRRYHRSELREKLTIAGFEVSVCRYFDLSGVIPWLVINRWMGSTSFNRTLARLYDRAVVPIARRIETIPPPIGKNLVVIGCRS